MAARKSARRSPRPSARARQKTATRSSPGRPKSTAGRGRKAARQTRRKRAATRTTRRPRAKSGAAPKAASAKRRPAPRPKARAAKRPRTTAPLKNKVAARPRPKAQTVPTRRPAAKPVAKPHAPARPPRPAAPARPHAARPALDRQRRILPEAEGLEREAADQGVLAAARSGGEELQHRLEAHTESSPALTAGDVDARWDDAYAVGDEAPGGDNPTPDQDRVDDIGKALGVTYDDAEELQGSNKITERDRHRWELDPASSDDWPHDKE